jgi:phosphate transport system protein
MELAQYAEPKQTRSRFQNGLDQLRDCLIAMSRNAEHAVELAIEAYQLRDSERCEAVLQLERKINEDERHIDEIAIELLAMQQPMAIDLRFVAACMKINADLERVGDEAVSIARRSLNELKLPEAKLPVSIDEMAKAVAGMIRRALDAFVSKNAELANVVLEMDDIVDRMNMECCQAMVQVMKESTEVTEQALDALIVSKNLERVADHATNIAEDVIFWVRGIDVRHNATRPQVS